MNILNWTARLTQKVARKLFPRVTSYTFSLAACHAMHTMSCETHPKEAFGVLMGGSHRETLIIERVVYQPFVNTRSSAVVMIDPHLTGTAGTFHSHPGGDGRPSAADKRLFAKRPGVHCIVPEPYVEAYVYDQFAELLSIEPLTKKRTN